MSDRLVAWLGFWSLVGAIFALVLAASIEPLDAVAWAVFAVFAFVAWGCNLCALARGWGG